MLTVKHNCKLFVLSSKSVLQNNTLSVFNKKSVYYNPLNITIFIHYVIIPVILGKTVVEACSTLFILWFYPIRICFHLAS